jgi:ferredoxin
MPRVVFIGLEGETCEVDAPGGSALVDLCDTANAPIPFSCRSASCGTCRLVVLEGPHLLAEAEDDELQVLDAFGQGPPDRRLACQAKLLATAAKHEILRVRAARDDE